ncbi:MAG: carotenoid 1,2-hydratase [Polyangiaceae bacterium]
MAQGGYAWWYVDAVSDDGRYALVLIAMIGSAFSPAYAAARRRGPANPLDFVAMNVVLYGPGGRRWALTERAGATRTHDALGIGPSLVRREGDALVIDVDERTTPFGARVRGRIRVEPEVVCGAPRTLDAAGAHRWWPIAPRARVRVDMSEPDVHWAGDGYHDANAGDAPLESAFQSWQWSRAPIPGGALVSYAVERRDGTSAALDLRFGANGPSIVAGLTPRTLPKSGWRIARAARSEGDPRVVRTLEDTPFYARSLVELEVEGRRTVAVHEALSLERFDQRWVRMLLPARIRRVAA